MEQTLNKRPLRTRKAPAGLSEYDTAREESPANPERRIQKHTPSPAREWAGKQVRSPKRRKFEETAVPSNIPLASPIPGASDKGSSESEAEGSTEDSEAEGAHEEQGSERENQSGAAEPSALMQLPQELLAKILGALPSNFLIQASGVHFPSPPSSMTSLCSNTLSLTCQSLLNF